MRLFLLFAVVFFHTDTWAQQASRVKLLCNWDDPAHILLNMTGQRYNDVWGFTVKGREYAAIGSTEGVHIIDIDNCRQVAFYPGKVRDSTVIHRDYKTYRNYLYAVCDEGFSSLQIFDLNYLPDSLHLIYESDPLEFMLAHNIFIDTAKATLYAATHRTLFSSHHMKVYSLEDPVHPRVMDIYNNHAFVHDVYVRNDTAYCSSSNYGFEVIDFSRHGEHRKIGELAGYPYQGYNHSSWINSKGYGVMADETHGSPLKVIDARKLSNIEVVSNFSPRFGDSTCIPHNPYLVDDFVFISHYMDGLQIYDISDPKNPRHAGYYDTYPGADFRGFAGAWGCYPYLASRRVLISDMQTGLYVFDVSEATGWKTHGPISEFNLYPNPAYDKVFIELPPAGDQDTADIGLFDMAGRVLQKTSAKTADHFYRPIELTLPGNMPGGIYIIRAILNGKKYTAKLSKL